MNYLFLFLFSFSFTHDLWAQGLENFLVQESSYQDDDGTNLDQKILKEILSNPKFIVLGMSKLIESRCKQYVVLNPFNIFERFKCKSLGKSFAQVLDYHQELTEVSGESFYIRLVFKKKLIELLNSAKTTFILSSVLEDLKKDYFNLYDSFFTQTQDHEAALMYIAVLLQDTTDQPLHLEYAYNLLKKNPSSYSSVFKRNVELTANIINKLNSAEYSNFLLRKKPSDFFHSKIIDFFPNRSLLNQAQISNKSYHYYVPAYITLLLQKYFNYNAEHSYLTGFSFNYFYEIVFIPEFKLLDWKTFQELLSIRDPIIKDTYKAFDIYLGHEGALFGLQYFLNFIPYQYFVAQLGEKPQHVYRKIIQKIKY